MTKVLMIGSDSSVKGGITSVINQIRDFDWEKENIKMNFIPTYISANALFMILFFCRAVLLILFRLTFFRPDVVYIHMSYKGSFKRKYFIHRLCKMFSVKDIVHLHGSEFEKWYNSSDAAQQNKIRKLLYECDKVIALGDEWQKKVLNIEPSTKTEVVKNTIKIPDIKVKWQNEKCCVLFLGVLIKRKGISDLLDAISLLKNSGKIGNLHFIIAGSGEEEIYLKRKTNELGIEDLVEFTGWIDGDAKKKLFEQSQIMVLPSYNEGLPISVLEAISYGMPVIATDVGDIKSAVHDNENGFTVSPGDIKNLSEALCKIDNEATYKKMSERSREIAMNDFADTKYFSQLAAIFNRL